MKKSTFFIFTFLFTVGTLVTSCDKTDKEPAVTVAGNYSGSFEGTFMGNDTLTSSGYDVEVTVVNDNKIQVFGNNFEIFDVLVTANGLNVEPVSVSDPYLLDFIYVGDEKRLKFTYEKDGNEAEFIGVKP